MNRKDCIDCIPRNSAARAAPRCELIRSRKKRALAIGALEEIHVEYVTAIRDSEHELPQASKLHGAVRKRKHDDENNNVIPHSFT